MERMNWKKLLLVTMIAIGSNAYGQFGVSVGPSFLRPFGAQKSFFGFHVGGEYSLDDQSSYFGRITHYTGARDTLGQEVVLQALNSTSPYATTSYVTKTNYTCISGGARYYLGDGYEHGLSAYGGSTLNLIFNQVKAEFEPYDQTNYTLPDGYARKGNAFGFGLGLQGGVKYGIIDFATVYLDFGLDYLFAYQASNTLSGSSPYLSNILFHFNLGFRKDIGGW